MTDATSSLPAAPQVIGRAPIPRFYLFAAITLSTAVAAGAWQMISALDHARLAEVPHTWADLRAGRTTGALATQMEKEMPARTSLIAAANAARYVLTGGSDDQVRPGKQGWLFLTDELRYQPQAAANLAARANLLQASARALKRQGVQLLVVLVPDKARVYPGYLAAGRYPGYNQSRYQDALGALAARNVETVDLLAPLARSAQTSIVFYSSDTHWNQTGAGIAAQAVAQKVAGIKRQQGISLTPTTFATAATGSEVERAGDMIRLMGLDNMPNGLRPPPDREVVQTTRQTSVDDSAGSLFGDVSVPVVLTGTSFSLRGNFHGYLQQTLSAKVLNTAKDGGGFSEAASAYLKDESFRMSKPQILIWEIPERFLTTTPEKETDNPVQWLKKIGLPH